jgi:single-strand DNA-binding protein
LSILGYSNYWKKKPPKFYKNHPDTAFFEKIPLRYDLFRGFTTSSKWRYDEAITRRGDELLINQVTIVGRLTKDPELKMTTEGTPVSQVTVACSRHFRNQNGEIEADFIPCTLWRKSAENTVQFCRKGSVVGVTGRLQTRHYDNKEGKRVYVTEVVAEAIRFLSSKPHETATVEIKKEELPF